MHSASESYLTYLMESGHYGLYGKSFPVFCECSSVTSYCCACFDLYENPKIFDFELQIYVYRMYSTIWCSVVTFREPLGCGHVTSNSDSINSKEPLKVLSSSGIRGTKSSPVYNFPAQ